MAKKTRKIVQCRAPSKKKNPWAEIKNSLLNAVELSRLGNGEIAYIRTLSYQEARDACPTVTGLKKKETYFMLFEADGTLLAITNDRASVFAHAIGEELKASHVH